MKIMIIRHAEKPDESDDERGVTLGGHHDGHELTVRGWQRAGALVRFFAPTIAPADDAVIATPRSIFASAATRRSPSLRSQHTVQPLAALLGISIDQRFPEGDEDRVAAAALTASSPVLISWHHKHIALLVQAIAGETVRCPQWWPDDRFDVVWILDRAGPEAPWRFSQSAQSLLPGDRPTAI